MADDREEFTFAASFRRSFGRLNSSQASQVLPAHVGDDNEHDQSLTSVAETHDETHESEASAGPEEIPSISVSESNSRSGSFKARENYGSPSRFSSVRTLTYADLEKGAKRYYRQNSLSFGQVAPVDEVLEELFDGEAIQEHSPENFDLEKGENEATDVEPVIENLCKSAQCQDLLPTKGGLPEKSSEKHITKTKTVGDKSRLKTIILEQNWFTVYKRLYVASLVLNITGLVLATTGHFRYAKSRAALFSLGNILMCVLVRSEVILRVVFWLAVYLLGYPWIPLKLKTMTTALLQSLGGIHSGCGLGAVAWLVYSLVQSFLGFQKGGTASASMVTVACSLLFMLLCSSLAAFPIFRHLHHNSFERVHRFAGWASLGLVWAYVGLASFWNPATQSYHISTKQQVQFESLWLTVASTTIIILPWLFVRKVAVETVVPPNKFNSLLHFEGGVEPGLLARISPSPFSEWHAFGIISDGKKRHTILAGAVGDFTKSLVENPPSHIWVRTFHFAGLPYLVNLYRKVLMVATGSGIGVYLSFLMQETKADVHMIWIAKRIRESFGDGIWEEINRIPPEKLTVIDTAVSGRPKTLLLVVAKAKEWRADVVVVTSNPSGTNEIVNGCKAVGIPAFGPIWDS